MPLLLLASKESSAVGSPCLNAIEVNVEAEATVTTVVVVGLAGPLSVLSKMYAILCCRVCVTLYMLGSLDDTSGVSDIELSPLVRSS
jgi:hypothetical protein